MVGRFGIRLLFPEIIQIELCVIGMKRFWKRIGNYEICWRTNQIRRATPCDGRTYVGRLLHTYVSEGGYIGVKVTIDKKHYERFHQIVALAYHGQCPKEKEVNHEDCNKQNNDPRNLEYVTRKENVEHAKKNGLMKKKLTENMIKEVIRLRLTSKYTVAEIEKKYQVSCETVRSVFRSKDR